MIASLRGLVVLGALAFVLAVAVIIDVVRGSGPLDRRLVHQDLSYAQRLTWPDLTAQRSGDSWQSVNLMPKPGEEAGIVILDTAAINDVLRTLAAARWHRRGGSPGTVHTTLDVDGTKIQIADPLPGSDQTWLVVDGTSLLVDGWVARALAPGALALHVRHPLASAARSDTITMFGPDEHFTIDVHLKGHPRRDAGSGLFAPVDGTRALERAFADAEAVGLGRSAGSAGDPTIGLNVFLDDAAATVLGSCNGLVDLVAIHSIYGDECITKTAWDRIVEAARPLANGVELRPVLGEPATVTLADGTAVDLHADQAAALVHALVTPAQSTARMAPPAELTHLTVTLRGGEKAELRVWPSDYVLRVADGAVLQLAHADWLALQAPASTYADPTRWSEDPTTVETIGAGGVTYHRGAVLGEWTPAGPLNAAAVTALAAGLASVRARDAAPAPTAHIFTVTLAPPVGAQVTHTLELGSKCAGRIDGKPVTFEPTTCQALEHAVH